MKIGYFYDTYPYKRNVIDKVGGESYKLLNSHDDISKIIISVLLRIFNKFSIEGKIITKFKTRVMVKIQSYKKYDVDLIHSFNQIIDTKYPYVITFETGVPRCRELLSFHHEIKIAEYNKDVKKYIYELSNDKCKKLIAMSKSAKKICEDEIKESGVSEHIIQSILKKMIVLHPPQKTLVTEKQIQERFKNMEEKIRFIFIGRDFFRKGGKEVIEGLRKYADRCELILISSMNYGDYASYATEEEQINMIQFISNQNWIKWIESCDNQKVLELCQTAHVGLLPTYADTYGYSVLEMQACGVPVITTNVRALTEINSDDCGWVAILPVNEYGEALYSEKQSREEMKEQLQKELESILESIFMNPDIIEKKASASLKRIQMYHSPEKYAEKIKKIYCDTI